MMIESRSSGLGKNAEILLPAKANIIYVIHQLVASYSLIVPGEPGRLTVDAHDEKIFDINFHCYAPFKEDHAFTAGEKNTSVLVMLHKVTGAFGKLNVIYEERRTN